jgi:hypothetical protein
MMRTGWVLLGFMGLSAPAAAAEGAYMWGAGFNLGTSFLPGRYPYAFPSSIAKYDFRENGALAGDPKADEPDRDLDELGDPRYSTLSGVGFDLRLGGDVFYGWDKQNRIGAGAATTTTAGSPSTTTGCWSPTTRST